MKISLKPRGGLLIAFICIGPFAVCHTSAVSAQTGFVELVPSGPTTPLVAPGGSAWELLFSQLRHHWGGYLTRD
jgi:hypothetical protein